VPRMVVPILSYPLTASGKVDFVALKAIGQSLLLPS
jgi:hypothetical protein